MNIIQLNKCLYQIYSEIFSKEPFAHNNKYYLMGEDDTVIEFRIVASAYNICLVEFNNNKAGKPPHLINDSILFNKKTISDHNKKKLNPNLTYQYISNDDLEHYIFGLKKLEYIWEKYD